MTSVIRMAYILKIISAFVVNGVIWNYFCFIESKVPVAKLVVDEITELIPSKVVCNISTDGGGVRIGWNGLTGRVGLAGWGRECANAIIVHNTKMINEFLFIFSVFFCNIWRFKKLKSNLTRLGYQVTRNAPLNPHLYALIVCCDMPIDHSSSHMPKPIGNSN